MKKRFNLNYSDFLLPLIFLPLGYFGVSWYETGFSAWLLLIPFVILFIVLPIIVVFRKP